LAELAREVARTLADKGTSILDFDDLTDVVCDALEGHNADCEGAYDAVYDLLMNGLINVVNLEPESEVEVYLFLPRDVEPSEDEYLFFRAALAAAEDRHLDSKDAYGDAADIIVRYLYMKYYKPGDRFAEDAGGDDWAWYIWKIRSSYGLE
jgi:hypothetical protein